MSDITDLKKDVFFRILEKVGRVFVLVRHSDTVVIGNRGFLQGEMENGLVLVFNSKMNFNWDSSGIHATLVFGTAPEKCYIHPDDIISVYSPELGVQFIASPEKKEEKEIDSDSSVRDESGAKNDDKIIKVDFKKKKCR